MYNLLPQPNRVLFFFDKQSQKIHPTKLSMHHSKLKKEYKNMYIRTKAKLTIIALRILFIWLCVFRLHCNLIEKIIFVIVIWTGNNSKII